MTWINIPDWPAILSEGIVVPSWGILGGGSVGPDTPGSETITIMSD